VLLLFNSYLLPYKEEENDKNDKETEAFVNNAIFFSMIWGCGGVLEESARKHFHKLMMNLISFVKVTKENNFEIDDPLWETRGISLKLNDPKNVYNILYDTRTNTWVDWLKTVPQWVPPTSRSAEFN
jgi:Dynein heavy chain AAA lid domain